MKNITLSVDETLLDRARDVARERGTSVNALVRDFLERLARAKEDERQQYQNALAEIREMSRNARVAPEGEYAFSREDAYGDRLR